MHTITALIMLGGAVHLIIAASNYFVRRMLKPEKELVNVSPMIREIYFVHWIYIVFVLLIFACLSFVFAPALAGGQALGRFLSGVIAVFWLARVPIQLFYYDRGLRRAHRVIDVTCIAAFVFLGLVYGIAASGVQVVMRNAGDFRWHLAYDFAMLGNVKSRLARSGTSFCFSRQAGDRYRSLNRSHDAARVLAEWIAADPEIMQVLHS